MKSFKRSVVTFTIVLLFICSALVPTIYGSNIRDNIFQNSRFFQKKQVLNLKEVDSQDFNETLKEIMKIGHIPGLSVCIVKNKTVVWSDGFGLRDIKNHKNATDDTVHPIASVTKLFTATAIMQLYEKGFFELDDDVSKYLGFNLKNPNYPKKNITFRMLLAHQSSLADMSLSYIVNFMILGYPRTWLKDYFTPGGILYNPRSFEKYAPGKDVLYSNLNIEILGLLVEILSEQSYEKYVKENILEPLEMYNTSFYLSDFDINKLARQYIWLGFHIPIPHIVLKSYAAGGLRSTVLDLSHFLIAFINGGVYNENRILTQESIDKMFTLQYPDSFDDEIFRFGLGWYFWNNTDNVTIGGHGGVATAGRAELRLRIHDKVGVIYCWNHDHILRYYLHFPKLYPNDYYAYEQLGRIFFDYADQLK